jgi:hypothetical protein
VLVTQLETEEATVLDHPGHEKARSYPQGSPQAQGQGP